jgi:hypothetical protein
VSHLRQTTYTVGGQQRRLMASYQAMLKLLDVELAKGKP